jgi:hypothetical protein
MYVKLHVETIALVYLPGLSSFVQLKCNIIVVITIFSHITVFSRYFFSWTNGAPNHLGFKTVSLSFLLLFYYYNTIIIIIIIILT